jgi:hypothetical protein
MADDKAYGGYTPILGLLVSLGDFDRWDPNIKGMETSSFHN